MHHLRIVYVTTATLGLTIGFAACSDDDDATSTTATVATIAPAPASPATVSDAPVITIAGGSFGDPLTVTAGTTVTVVNDSLEAHTLTADDGSFSTGELAPGASATVTLETPGTFTFHCAFHISMQGSINVTA